MLRSVIRTLVLVLAFSASLEAQQRQPSQCVDVEPANWKVLLPGCPPPAAQTCDVVGPGCWCTVACVDRLIGACWYAQGICVDPVKPLESDVEEVDSEEER